MKYIKITLILLGFFIVDCTQLLSQDCTSFYEQGFCMSNRQKGYKLYSQSKSVPVKKNEPVEFNVIFYGQKDYILAFCTNTGLYPVSFVIMDPHSHDVLYDNSQDNHIEILGIGFDKTIELTVQVKVLASITGPDIINTDTGCLGMYIQYKSNE